MNSAGLSDFLGMWFRSRAPVQKPLPREILPAVVIWANDVERRVSVEIDDRLVELEVRGVRIKGEVVYPDPRQGELVWVVFSGGRPLFCIAEGVEE